MEGNYELIRCWTAVRSELDKVKRKACFEQVMSRERGSDNCNDSTPVEIYIRSHFCFTKQF